MSLEAQFFIAGACTSLAVVWFSALAVLVWYGRKNR